MHEVSSLEGSPEYRDQRIKSGVWSIEFNESSPFYQVRSIKFNVSKSQGSPEYQDQSIKFWRESGVSSPMD